MVSSSRVVTIGDFEDLPIAAMVFELDGTIVAVNRATEQLHGRPAAELVGRMAWDYAPGTEHIWHEVVAAVRHHGVHRGEIVLATPTTPRQIAFVMTLRTVGERPYVVSYAIELPANPSPTVDAESKQRLEGLGLIAAGIAHDFNNQLVSVLAEATAAREDAALGEGARDALRRIEAAAHRMAQLTRQLLAYAGRGRFVTELLDPDDLVVQMQDQLKRLVRVDARLSVKPNAGRLAIEADRGLLRQVLENLVANASEALGDTAGSIDVATRQQSRAENQAWWVVEVRDNGRGMDARTVARIFDPFFTTKSDRRGLGLSAVQGIVRRFGGEIAVESSAGHGTTVTVKLPVIAGAEADRRRPRTSKQPPPATLKGLSILVADDEPSVRTTVRRLLDRRGATVVTAADGLQAKARLADGEYHLVIFDVMMPHLTGYQLLPFVREMQPGAKLLLMSGYSEHERAAGGDDEPDGFLEKPFTAKTLDRAIDDILRSGTK